MKFRCDSLTLRRDMSMCGKPAVQFVGRRAPDGNCLLCRCDEHAIAGVGSRAFPNLEPLTEEEAIVFLAMEG